MSNDTEASILVHRLKKAETIATLCQEFSITSETVKQLTEEQWEMLARLGEVNKPSPVTKDLVADTLAQREKLSHRLEELKKLPAFLSRLKSDG